MNSEDFVLDQILKYLMGLYETGGVININDKRHILIRVGDETLIVSVSKLEE